MKTPYRARNSLWGVHLQLICFCTCILCHFCFWQSTQVKLKTVLFLDFPLNFSFGVLLHYVSEPRLAEYLVFQNTLGWEYQYSEYSGMEEYGGNTCSAPSAHKSLKSAGNWKLVKIQIHTINIQIHTINMYFFSKISKQVICISLAPAFFSLQLPLQPQMYGSQLLSVPPSAWTQSLIFEAI